MYVAYAQPGAIEPHLQAHSISYTRPTDQVSYAAGAFFQNRGAQSEGAASYLSNAPRRIPEVSSWSPQQGPPGSRMFIFLISAFELDPSWRLEVEFGSHRCNATLRRVESQGSYYQYALSAEVPSFSATGWGSTQVPVSIVAQDQSGLEIALVKLTPAFTYTDASISQLANEASRKRRLSDEPSELIVPFKRAVTQHERNESNSSYGSPGYGYLRQSTPSYLHQSPHLALDTSINNVLPAYQRAQTQSSNPRQDSPLGLQLQLSSTNPISAPVRSRSPQTPSWSIANLNGGRILKSPGIAGSTNSRTTALASPSALAHPPLVRTSTLQQSPSPSSTPAGASAPSTFNPYAIYPHKASLMISGSLDSMIENWSEEEKDVKRRLVQFWRSQTRSTITTTFKPVAPEDRQPSSICISCIWWESRNEYYVTSVDTIYLLESLVAVRFTVEEKNRIRRNLEGFRPMTVSKGKSDSEDFFKLIMGFPNPKPRNIEKDVKVFPWKILSHALKKIIGKYVSETNPFIGCQGADLTQSASYSSTAGALPPSMSSNLRGPQAQDFGGDLLPASPHSNAESSISVAYPSPMTATTMSSEVPHAQATSPYPGASPAILSATMPPGYQPYPYPQAHLNHSSGAMPMTAQQVPQQHGRPSSWDYATFMEPTTVASRDGLYAVDPTQNAGQYQMTHASSGA